jgi:hypothetical protein
MDGAELNRIYELCTQIAIEQDQAKFLELLTELNRLLRTTELHSQNAQPSEAKAN